jgi:hypothetical protein
VLQRLRDTLNKWIIDSDDQGQFPEVIAPAAEKKAKAQTKQKK